MLKKGDLVKTIKSTIGAPRGSVGMIIEIEENYGMRGLLEAQRKNFASQSGSVPAWLEKDNEECRVFTVNFWGGRKKQGRYRAKDLEVLNDEQ